MRYQQHKKYTCFLFLTQNTHFCLKISTIALGKTHKRTSTPLRHTTTLRLIDMQMDGFLDACVHLQCDLGKKCKFLILLYKICFTNKCQPKCELPNHEIFCSFQKKFRVVSFAFSVSGFRPRINEAQFQEPKCRKSGELLQLTTTVVGKVKFLYSPADKYRIYSRYSSRAVATYHAECHDVKHELPTQRWLP